MFLHSFRSIEAVHKPIDHSLCFGVYQNDHQVGFARAVTDHAVFAWIPDVFILENFRNKGHGKLLMDHIMAHPQLQNIRRWGLNTDDAHGLYAQYGFKYVKTPERYMEKISKP